MSTSPLARSAATLALALLGAAGAAAQSMPTATGNAAHDMMVRLSPAERSRTLDRVLHSVDHGFCDVVEATFVSYRSGVSATWRATCFDGRRFVLDLMDGSDWSVTVIDCAATSEHKARCAP